MLGFLIALGAGAVTPMLEAPLARPLAQSMSRNLDLADGELRALSFMIALVIAGVLCALFSTGSPLGLAVGGALGYFGVRLVRWLQRVIQADRS